MRTTLPFLGPCLILLCSTAWAQSKQEFNQLKSGQGTVCYAHAVNSNTYVGPPLQYRQMKAGARTKSAGIDVTYQGFTPEAQAAFEAAVNIWESLLTTDVTIRILARWVPLGESVLGSASPGTYYRNFDAAQRKNIWYPIALAEKMSRENLNGTDPDIVASFNSTFDNWHYGLESEIPPADKYDLMSVVLHEIGHGLGIIDSYEVTGATGTIIDFFSGSTMIYDFPLEDSGGQTLLTTFDSPSTGLGTALTSQALFYNTPLVLNVNGDQRAKIYAPSTYSAGSSTSHLDEDTYLGGTPNSLMTPSIAMAERILDPGPIVTEILKTMGWITSYIEHTPLKGTEDLSEPFEVVCKVTTDTSFDPENVFLNFSTDGTRFTEVQMAATGTPTEFKAIIPNNAATYRYFIRVTDDDDRNFRKPGQLCIHGEPIKQEVFTFEAGPDTKAPIINHVPVQFMTTFDTLRVEAVISDNIGVLEATMQWQINGVAQSDITLSIKPGTDSTYYTGIIFPEGSLEAGESIKYRITARDKSVAGNIGSIPSSSTFYEVNVTGLLAEQDSYVNDFNDLSGADFFGTGFSVTKPAGFVDGAIHSEHPYQMGEGSPDDRLNFTYQLQIPIRIKDGESLVKFDEVVLVEPGEAGAPFGSDDFFDYVVVEGSRDGGVTWIAIDDGYDSRDDAAWLSAYNGAIVGQNSTAVGSPSLYRTRIVNLHNKFQKNEVVAIRFRLYSDPLAVGWGWAIDNLLIQVDDTSPVIKHQHVDHLMVGTTELSIDALITDGGGLQRVMTEYMVNDGELTTHELIINPGEDLFFDVLDFPELVSGDDLFYRIKATDSSGNEGVYPSVGFFKVAALSFASPVDHFETDFSSPVLDISGNFFTTEPANGFADKAMHSPHPYPAAIGPDPSASTFTLVVRKAIRVNEANPYIRFDEIVVTEYQGNTPVDFVVLEASKDGITWQKLIPEHAANFHADWKSTYDAGETAIPNLYRTRLVRITDVEGIEPDDVILVRFRLFSNQEDTGWGFAIDNLTIQGVATGVSHVDETFSIFPNPAAGRELHVRLSPGRNSEVGVQLVSPQGRVLRTEQFIASDDVIDHTVPIAELPAGLYLLRVRTPRGLSVGKFIKVD
jgi:hypothetical protein